MLSTYYSVIFKSHVIIITIIIIIILIIIEGCIGYMYFASRIIFFKCFLVPLVSWFELFHIAPRVSVGSVVAVFVTCCFLGCGC